MLLPPLGGKPWANPTKRLALEKSQCGRPHWLFENCDVARCCRFYGVLIAVNDAVTLVLLPVGVKAKVQGKESPGFARKAPPVAL